MLRILSAQEAALEEFKKPTQTHVIIDKPWEVAKRAEEIARRRDPSIPEQVSKKQFGEFELRLTNVGREEWWAKRYRKPDPIISEENRLTHVIVGEQWKLSHNAAEIARRGVLDDDPGIPEQLSKGRLTQVKNGELGPYTRRAIEQKDEEALCNVWLKTPILEHLKAMYREGLPLPKIMKDDLLLTREMARDPECKKTDLDPVYYKGEEYRMIWPGTLNLFTEVAKARLQELQKEILAELSPQRGGREML